MQYAVEFNHVWKQYATGSLLQRARHILLPRRVNQADLGKGPGWATRDVSFALTPGDTLGLIGHNGAGKTTALRLLASITEPTFGRVTTRGRLAALIALGAGFHRELTGRENVYLNGVILGLTRAEIRRKFDAIVEFADLGEQIDVPVKFYSSGMYARLGFSVAAHVEPEVLLVDEVLSVGDQSFQTKSLRRMTDFRNQGCTIVFVSHRMSAVSFMCQQAAWLERGQVRMHGPTSEVVRNYLQDIDRQLTDELVDPEALITSGSGELIVDQVVLRDAGQGERSEFYRGEEMVVDIHYRVFAPIRNPMFVITVTKAGGEGLFAASMPLDGYETGELQAGRGVIRCRFEPPRLLPGKYVIGVQVKRDIVGDAFTHRQMAAFSIGGRLADFGLKGEYADSKGFFGSHAIYTPYQWEGPFAGQAAAVHAEPLAAVD